MYMYYIDTFVNALKTVLFQKFSLLPLSYCKRALDRCSKVGVTKWNANQHSRKKEKNRKALFKAAARYHCPASWRCAEVCDCHACGHFVKECSDVYIIII